MKIQIALTLINLLLLGLGLLGIWEPRGFLHFNRLKRDMASDRANPKKTKAEEVVGTRTL